MNDDQKRQNIINKYLGFEKLGNTMMRLLLTYDTVYPKRWEIEKMLIVHNKLRNILKQEGSLTFQDSLNEAKIKKAKNLLLNTDLDVHEISLRCGYLSTNNNTAFNKAFKLWTGSTPKQYREVGPQQNQDSPLDSLLSESTDF